MTAITYWLIRYVPMSHEVSSKTSGSFVVLMMAIGSWGSTGNTSIDERSLVTSANGRNGLRGKLKLSGSPGPRPRVHSRVGGGYSTATSQRHPAVRPQPTSASTSNRAPADPFTRFSFTMIGPNDVEG